MMFWNLKRLTTPHPFLNQEPFGVQDFEIKAPGDSPGQPLQELMQLPWSIQTAYIYHIKLR